MSKHKHFYHHLLVIDTIHIGLDALELTPEEKQELLDLAESNIHHKVLDTVLSELNESDKKTFLAFILDDNNPQIWKLLKEKVTNAEEKITKTVNDFIKSLHKDIQEAHKKKHS